MFTVLTERVLTNFEHSRCFFNQFVKIERKRRSFLLSVKNANHFYKKCQFRIFNSLIYCCLHFMQIFINSINRQVFYIIEINQSLNRRMQFFFKKKVILLRKTTQIDKVKESDI